MRDKTGEPLESCASVRRAHCGRMPVRPSVGRMQSQRSASAAAAGSGSALKPGTYRVVLQIPGGDLPFGLDLSREDSAWLGYLVNGAERVKLSEVAVDGGHLEIKMPGYENRLTAEAEGDQLRGELVLDKWGARTSTFPSLRSSIGTTGSFRNPPASCPALRDGTRLPSPTTTDGPKRLSASSRNRTTSSAERS